MKNLRYKILDRLFSVNENLVTPISHFNHKHESLMHTISVVGCYDSESMMGLLLLWNNVEIARRKIERFNMSQVTYFSHIRESFIFQYKWLFEVRIN